MDRKELIRAIYLYLFSLVGLVLVVIGCVRLLDLGLRMFIFTKADRVLVYPGGPRAIPATPNGGKEVQISPEEEQRIREEQQRYEEESRDAQRQRTAANSLAMIIVGVPIFAYHWRTIQKDKSQKNQ